MARERIRNNAHYTKSGRKPWTQITAPLPIHFVQLDNSNGENARNTANANNSTTTDQDLTVIWALLREYTRTEVSENNSGDLTWPIQGSQQYLEWLEMDRKNMKPVNMYVHPVKYETGARKNSLLQTKLMKAKRFRNKSEIASLE